MSTQKNAFTLKNLTKSNVWDIQENDIARAWAASVKESDYKDNLHRYMDIIRTAFELEEVLVDKPVVIEKYEQREFKVFAVGSDEKKKKFAVKKRPIRRITDLTYENIRHISAAKLIEVLDNNFGGGWDSIPQNIKDIILSTFDISTTTLPKERMHKKGSMYEKMVAEGYDVLEIAKGSWTEAIFAKLRPVIAKPLKKDDDEYEQDEDIDDEDIDMNDEEDDDDLLDDDITNESYLSEFDPEDAENIGLDDVVAAEDGDDY